MTRNVEDVVAVVNNITIRDTIGRRVGCLKQAFGRHSDLKEIDFHGIDHAATGRDFEIRSTCSDNSWALNSSTAAWERAVRRCFQNCSTDGERSHVPDGSPRDSR
jgi:hypothetical protein